MTALTDLPIYALAQRLAVEQGPWQQKTSMGALLVAKTGAVVNPATWRCEHAKTTIGPLAEYDWVKMTVSFNSHGLWAGKVYGYNKFATHEVPEHGPRFVREFSVLPAAGLRWESAQDAKGALSALLHDMPEAADLRMIPFEEQAIRFGDIDHGHHWSAL